MTGEMMAMRDLWLLVEGLHSVIYFAPEKVDLYEQAGLRGGWMGYFASRSAALGPVGSEVVTALFYNFHPDMVRRSIPDAWKFATPEDVVAARYEAADRALQRLLPGADAASDGAAAVGIVHEAVGSLDVAGRPLFAAHAAGPWPDPPLLALWHACTLWREYRGDGHVAALVAEGIDGCEAHILLSAAGRSSEKTLRENRGWSLDEWDSAKERLRQRAVLDNGGALTPEGIEFRSRIERRTDELSAEPWNRLGVTQTASFADHIRPLVRQIAQGGGIPFPNPMGFAEAELQKALFN